MDDLNLFEVLTRESKRSRYDPSERRLVAVLHAVLTVSPGLRRAFVAACSPTDSPVLSGDIGVNREVAAHGRWIDLELRASGSTKRLWIEAKLNSPLSGTDQLDVYADLLRARGGGRVVLLAPEEARLTYAGGLPGATTTHDGDQPVFLSWQSVYAALKKATVPTKERWPRDQALAYLTNEGLAPVKPLTTQDLKTLRSHEESLARLSAVVEAAAERVDRRWQPREEEAAKRHDARGWWARHPPKREAGSGRAGWGRDGYFSWGVEVPAGTVYAGGWWTPSTSTPRKVRAADAWASAMEEDNWTIERISNELGAYRELSLETVLNASPQQASEIAKFVVATFKALSAAQPPLETKR